MLEVDSCTGALINDVDGVPALPKRRSCSVKDKRRILDESLAEGALIAEVGRRHDLIANQLCTWRRRIGGENPEPHGRQPEPLAPFVPVTIMTNAAALVYDDWPDGERAG